MPVSSKPLSLGEIARYCQVDRVTVQRWVKKALIEAYRTPGGHFRVPLENFRTFLLVNNLPIDPAFFGDLPLRILISDGAGQEGERLGNHLQGLLDNCEVKVAATGPEALLLLGQFQPDLAVLDLHQPGLREPGLCRMIRRTLPQAIRILALIDQEAEASSALKAGADQCLVKPVDREIFCTAVQSLLRLEKKEEEENAARRGGKPQNLNPKLEADQ